MDYFIRNQYESADRNSLDKEMREWASQKLHHVYVDVSHMHDFINYIKAKAAELNAKYPRVQKKLDVHAWEGQKEVMNIRISECLQYVAYKVKTRWTPF